MGAFFEGTPSRGWIWATGMFVGIAIMVLTWLCVRPFHVASMGFAVFGAGAVFVAMPVAILGLVELVAPRPPPGTSHFWTPSKWRKHALQNFWIGVAFYVLVVGGAALFAGAWEP